MAKFNYRKFYEEQTDAKIPEKFVIHHIDHDKNNNKLYNLLALPNGLHLQYHKNYVYCFNLAEGLNNIFSPLKTIIGQGMDPAGEIENQFQDQIREFTKLKDRYRECQYWLLYRQYLLGEVGIFFSNRNYEIGD